MRVEYKNKHIVLIAENEEENQTLSDLYTSNVEVNSIGINENYVSLSLRQKLDTEVVDG